MKVRTIRKHSNAHGPVYVKHWGRKYEVTERDGANLIAAGMVEEDKPETASDEADSED